MYYGVCSRRLLNFYHIVEFKSVEVIKKFSEEAILIDVRNPYFNRKITKKLNKIFLELKTWPFLAKFKKPLELGP